jgi:hypothetical protein
MLCAALAATLSEIGVYVTLTGTSDPNVNVPLASDQSIRHSRPSSSSRTIESVQTSRTQIHICPVSERACAVAAFSSSSSGADAATWRAAFVACWETVGMVAPGGV